MATSTAVEDRIKRLDERLARYIPPRETWTPVDEALYRPINLFEVPKDEAQMMQLKAIKYAFTRQYTLNDFYHSYCDKRGVIPENIKTYDDLEKIPLIPDLVFKQYPSGADFAHWIANLYVGDLPTVTINTSHPTFDQVINAFNTAGLVVTYSSGTSGRFTFIPRDQKTFLAGGYAVAKSLVTMWAGSVFETDGFLLFPHPGKTNIYTGKVCTVYLDLLSDVQVAIDRELTTDLIQTAMGGGRGLKGRLASYVQSRTQHKMIDQIIRWLEQRDKAGGKVSLVGAPYLLYVVMQKLQTDGKSFDFSDGSMVVTGGGWKVRENARMLASDFRKQVHAVLGIPETCCFDVYAMVEMTGSACSCPEGHCLHVPPTYLKPLILDSDFMPVGYDEWGRFAFLDALAYSYPGFIITGDQARMLEHCPVCDRPGPVLEPEVRRAPSEEMRGCAEQVRSIIAQDL